MALSSRMGADRGFRGPQMGRNRLQDSIHNRASPSIPTPTALSPPPVWGEERTVVVGDRRPSRKGRDHESTYGGVERPRLLQPSLPRSEGYRRVSSGPRHQSLEQVCRLSALPYGNGQKRTKSGASGRLGLLHRPDGRVLARTVAQIVEEIPSYCTFVVHGILFYRTAFRPEYCSAGFHKDSHGSSFILAPEGYTCSHIPRRLATSGPGSFGFEGTDPSDSEVSRDARILGKRGEIQTDSVTRVPVPGSPVRHQPLSGSPGRPPCGEDRYVRQKCKSGIEAVAQNPHEDDRASELNCRLRAPGSSKSSPRSTLAPSPVVSTGRRIRRPFARYSRSRPRSAELDGSGVASSRCASSEPGTDSVSPNGRITVRMGSPSRTPSGVRQMVSSGESRTYQCSRNESYPESAPVLHEQSARSGGSPLNRQRHLCLLSAEAGGDEVSALIGPDRRGLSFPGPGKDNSRRQTHSFTKECSSRLPFSSGSPPHGVVSGRESLLESTRSGSTAERRPLRHLHEQSVASIRQSVPGPVRGGSGRPVDPLGFSGSPIRLSSMEDAPICSGKDQKGSRPAGSGDRSKVAPATLDYRLAAAVSDKCTVASAYTQSVVSRPICTPQAPRVPPTRVDAIGDAITSLGFARHIADRVASGGRTSTQAVYDAKWKIYTDWCIPRQIDPVSSTGPQLAEFFTELFVVKGLAFSTLRGYKASILSVLESTNPLPTNHLDVLTKLFRTFSAERPVIPRAMPVWDLGLVLQGLKRFPFEPISHSDTRFLSLKTLFLLTLASGARRGEVRALIRTGITYTDRKEEVLVYPDPKFIPKTRRGVSSGKPFIIRSLCHLVDRDSPDRLLCPVRALKAFLRRTKDPAFLKGRQKLFLPLDETKVDLSAHGHKSQLIAAIQEAYSAMDLRLPEEFRLRMHDTRMLSFSLAGASGVSLDTILSAGSWKSHTAFTTCYLRSMAIYAENLYSLGPVSLPGAVVQPGSHRLTRSK